MDLSSLPCSRGTGLDVWCCSDFPDYLQSWGPLHIWNIWKSWMEKSSNCCIRHHHKCARVTFPHHRHGKVQSYDCPSLGKHSRQLPKIFPSHAQLAEPCVLFQCEFSNRVPIWKSSHIGHIEELLHGWWAPCRLQSLLALDLQVWTSSSEILPCVLHSFESWTGWPSSWSLRPESPCTWSPRWRRRLCRWWGRTKTRVLVGLSIKINGVLNVHLFLLHHPLGIIWSPILSPWSITHGKELDFPTQYSPKKNTSFWILNVCLSWLIP